MGTLAACAATQGPPADVDTEVETDGDTEIETDVETDVDTDTDGATDDTEVSTDDTDVSCASTLEVRMRIWDAGQGCFTDFTTRPMCADWWSDFDFTSETGISCAEVVRVHLMDDGTCFVIPSDCGGGPAGVYYDDPALDFHCVADPACCSDERLNDGPYCP